MEMDVHILIIATPHPNTSNLTLVYGGCVRSHIISILNGRVVGFVAEQFASHLAGFFFAQHPYDAEPTFAK